MATNRSQFVANAMDDLLHPAKVWSEDPETILRAVSDCATVMLAKMITEQPGALHTQAYWDFVATECGKLADRVHFKWLE